MGPLLFEIISNIMLNVGTDNVNFNELEDDNSFHFSYPIENRPMEVLFRIDEENAKAYISCTLPVFDCRKEKYEKIRVFLNARNQIGTMLTYYLDEEESAVKAHMCFCLHPGYSGPECLGNLNAVYSEMDRLFKQVREIPSLKKADRNKGEYADES